MTTMAKFSCRLVELPPLLHQALERMQAIEERRGPSVVITDKVTERFVQLFGGFGRVIALEVPVGNGNANQLFRERVAAELELSQRWEGLDMYRDKFRNAAVATSRACLFLNRVFDLPTTAELEVEEILAGMEKYSKNAIS